MLPRSLIGYLTVFSLSVGFIPTQASAESPEVTAAALQLKQNQQKNKAFLEQLMNTPKLSEAEIAKLPKADQTKYRTMMSSLTVLIDQLKSLDEENVRLGTSIQEATVKSAELDKKIDALRPAALQSTMNRPTAGAPTPGAMVPGATPGAMANSPRFMNPNPAVPTPGANPANMQQGTIPVPTSSMPPMRPSMPPSNTN